MKTLKNLVKSQQFTLEILLFLFKLTKKIKSDFQAGGEKREALKTLLAGKTILNLFYEPSTRTKFSFEHGAGYLGMDFHSTETAGQFSSAIKGETLQDSLHILCRYRPDLIVLRHKTKGSADIAVKITEKYGIPLINAGDGGGQHPSQALLDCYTIWEKFNRINNLRILMAGDLKYGRTTRSLTYLLAKFENVHISYFSPRILPMGSDILEYLERHGVECQKYNEASHIKSVLSKAHVVYWTRVQKERLSEIEIESLDPKVESIFSLNPNKISCMRKDAIIMHPLPRVNEIKPTVDKDSRAWYFKQAENGLYARMALMLFLLDPKKAKELINEK